MSMLHEEKVFKDPVHHYVYVQDELIWSLINTSEFQRLRRIRQLGTTYLTFHGAEHSRFNHSLGVYEITRKIISQFERNEYAEWPRDEKMVALCAALLHDVGHAPFSHSIEEIFDTDHEEWTIAIILGDTEINRVLKQYDKLLPTKVAQVIQKKYNKKIVVSLISSQLDADRMDYLLRDAYYTGTNYGNFDLERILRVLRPYEGRLVVKESGKHAIEHYLMSRYQMYWQIYFHPVTRSSEIILRQIFKRAKELYAMKYEFSWMDEHVLALIEDRLTIGNYLKLDESLFQYTFIKWMDEEDQLLSELCDRFINRKLYKYIVIEDTQRSIIDEIKNAFEQVGINIDYHVEIDDPYDRPYEMYPPGQASDMRKDKAPIMLLDKNGQLNEITEKSDIISSITGLRKGKTHLYYSEEQLINKQAYLDSRILQYFT